MTAAVEHIGRDRPLGGANTRGLDGDRRHIEVAACGCLRRTGRAVPGCWAKRPESLCGITAAIIRYCSHVSPFQARTPHEAKA